MSNPKKQQTNNVVLFLNLKNKLHQYISGVALWLSKALHFDNYAEQICFGLLLIVIKSTKKIELHISQSYFLQLETIDFLHFCRQQTYLNKRAF